MNFCSCSFFQQLKTAWAGYYDYNYFDQNLLIGPHPVLSNFYLATGCTGHGIQHSPAIGLAMAELLTSGQYNSIDLSRLSFDRVISGTPLFENNIVWWYRLSSFEFPCISLRPVSSHFKGQLDQIFACSLSILQYSHTTYLCNSFAT